MSKIEARIDKWLWAVRVFKTRTIAADACKKGRVMMGGVQVKPSRVVRPGDVVEVRIWSCHLPLTARNFPGVIRRGEAESRSAAKATHKKITLSAPCRKPQRKNEKLNSKFTCDLEFYYFYSDFCPPLVKKPSDKCRGLSFSHGFCPALGFFHEDNPQKNHF